VSSGQLVDRIGSAILFLVMAATAGWLWAYAIWYRGIDHWLHRTRVTYFDYGTGELETAVLRPGIEFVVIPFAVIAAGALRWGVEVIDAPPESRSLWLPLLGTAVVYTVIWLSWLAVPLVLVLAVAIAAWALSQAVRVGRVSHGDAIDEPREDHTWWLPWLGAAVALAVSCYVAWSWARPQTMIGPNDFGVARWAGTALLAMVTYLGMIFFPRLTASLAGAVVGTALFAVVGYILFPSFMRDPDGGLADTLVIASSVGATLVVTAALLLILLWEPFRRRPLSYAVWVGALTFCVAADGTFNGL